MTSSLTKEIQKKTREGPSTYVIFLFWLQEWKQSTKEVKSFVKGRKDPPFHTMKCFLNLSTLLEFAGHVHSRAPGRGKAGIGTVGTMTACILLCLLELNVRDLTRGCQQLCWGKEKQQTWLKHGGIPPKSHELQSHDSSAWPMVRLSHSVPRMKSNSHRTHSSWWVSEDPHYHGRHSANGFSNVLPQTHQNNAFMCWSSLQA